ncbi:cysteine-rich receptor-like protein kinase 6 [Phragmites australis]|uniref:cysteine-rich receptor-like protein kinase 6 n=1 Tax=Phragmites australis TaxID=29695 RepID=UPI002D78EAED|nr:cysteine-rich receptor-like protein kinase 6 [Phragmites australis]
MATGGRRRASSRLAAGLLLASLLAPLTAAQPWQVCGNNGSYTANSTYQSNLSQLSATLPTNASRALFATAAVGTVPEIAYALALCRGDSNASTCESCVATAFQGAQQQCAFQRNVAIFYDDCNLRFSDQNFLSTTNNDNLIMTMNPQNVSSSVEVFDAAVGILLNAISNYAATNSSRRFATGEEGFDRSNPTIYGLAQCTPDMSPADCRSCLQDIIALMPQYLSGRQGGRICGVRCNFRYELNKFFTGGPTLRLQTPLAPAPAPASNNATPMATPGGQTRNKKRIVLAIAMSVVAAILAISMVCLCFFMKRRPATEHVSSYSVNPEDTESINSLLLDISTLRAATDNFDESNRLGEGGFGAVYKGVLPDGQEIAVKRLSQSSGQGIQELKNELVLVAKLQHKNLVRLVGVCLQEHEKLLVYEYMPNRSIDTILFDPEKSKELDWGKRFKIINGIARGLRYLHEDSQFKIIHRDMKASNVLLDSDYTPKISDFGLARLFGGEQDESQEVTNRVVGTYGYMAPEYAMCGHYSTRSDVFSFGVLILEIITGRRSNGSCNLEESVDLLSLVWEHWTLGTIVEIMDSSLRGNAPEEQMLKCVHIGLLCVQDNPVDRPTMSTVNIMLSSNTVSLQAPLKPVFFIPNSGTYSNVYSEPYPTASQSSSK